MSLRIIVLSFGYPGLVIYIVFDAKNLGVIGGIGALKKPGFVRYEADGLGGAKVTIPEFRLDEINEHFFIQIYTLYYGKSGHRN